MGRCDRQNMLPPYLKIYNWELIFGRAVKSISSPGVRSPWSRPHICSPIWGSQIRHVSVCNLRVPNYLAVNTTFSLVQDNCIVPKMQVCYMKTIHYECYSCGHSPRCAFHIQRLHRVPFLLVI